MQCGQSVEVAKKVQFDKSMGGNEWSSESQFLWSHQIFCDIFPANLAWLEDTSGRRYFLLEEEKNDGNMFQSYHDSR
jgi:hypothetical protein